MTSAFSKLPLLGAATALLGTLVAACSSLQVESVYAASCTPAVSKTELLTDPGFEQGTSPRATAWDHNIWGGAAVSYGRDTAGPHGGATAQQVNVSTLGSGGFIFKQSAVLTGGTVYQGSIWLRSPSSATVDFLFRRAGPHYEPGAEARITLTPDWRQYVIRGGFSDTVPVYVGLNFVSPGTVIADDASLRGVGDTRCVASTAPVPHTYLGMHVNKWGSYRTWPSTLQFGTLRLWDTGTRWRDIQPRPGLWQWKRFDYYVKTAVHHRQAVLYTLGMTPRWASARPSAPEDGAVAEPANIATWRAYVRTVARRYKGRVKYWEIWNETNNSIFWRGSASKLVELTRAAREELKAVDPANVVLSPNFTESGNAFLSQFLNAGGGQYVDVVSVHTGGGFQPENRRPFIAAVQDLMRRAGIGEKPIWNTEGQSGGPASSDAGAGALLARTYLLEWAWGISNFTWYGWDLPVGSPLSLSNHVTPTAAGIAYRQVGDWLRGSRMLSKARARDGTWRITLRRTDGRLAFVVWNVYGTKTFRIPSRWRVAFARDLSGRTTSVRGRRVGIGNEPLLLLRPRVRRRVARR